MFSVFFFFFFFFSSRRRHTRSVSAFLLNRSSDLACKIRGLMVTVCPSQFATRRTLFHVLVGCGLLMLKVSRLKLPVIWLLVSMWLNTDRKSGSAGMPRPISYAVFCLKKKTIKQDPE